MPDEFIKQEGNDVTDAFTAYARPLLGSGFGSAQKLRAPRAAKLLKKD
jgi:6-phosphofructokinase 1